MKKSKVLPSPFFNALTKDEQSLIQEKLIKKAYKKGTTIFLEGQKMDGIYILSTGQVKVFMLYKDGREKTLYLLSEGEIMGEMTLFGSDLCSASVEAMTDTLFFVIPREEFKSLLINIPALTVNLIEVLSYRLRQSNHQIQELAFYNARNRVICNVLNLSKKYGQEYKGKVQLNIRLTHAELAKLAGVSRETATKVLNSLQDKSLISLTHRNLKIIDNDQLTQQLL